MVDHLENLFENDTNQYFTVSYAAEDRDLDSHRMDARMLAQAIENMAILVERSDKILNGGDRSLHLYVTAPAQEGSLAVQFFTEIFNQENAKNVLEALSLTGIIGAPSFGVFQVLRKISGREIIEIHTSDDSDEATIILGDEEIQCDSNIAKLVSSPKIREAVKQVVSKPLSDRFDPIFTLNPGMENPLIFSDADIAAIRELKTKAIAPKIEKFKATVTFDQLNFSGNKGWKVLLDGQIINAHISDEDFLAKTQANEQSFRKKDEFNVTLERTTYTDDFGRETYKYKILKVFS